MIGGVRIGSGHPVAIQSMVKKKAKDVSASVEQIRRLTDAGCEIVRIAVEDETDARALAKIKRQIKIPLVADIHFNYRLALLAVESGVDKVRLNPGNIYRAHEVEQVIAAVRAARIPIRIGANSGSLRVRAKDGSRALVQSVLDYLKIFKKNRFNELVVSLKGSNLMETLEAYEIFSKESDLPLHLGLTATGLPLDGLVKSSAGLGLLLFKGIGDTIRISLLDQPEVEVEAARMLLRGLGLRSFGPEIISCPTCGRCEVNLATLAKKFSKDLLMVLDKKSYERLQGRRIALMGCVVNGPGEAREADFGLAFSKKKAALFRHGKILLTIPCGKALEALSDLIKSDLLEGR